MSTHPIILFDGICNLCNNSIQYVIKHDPKAYFIFGAIQSASGQTMLKKYGLDPNNINSFILIQNNKIFTRSTAALKVAGKLNGPIKLLYVFIIIPPFIRNAVYNLIAKKRYHWFGKRNECMVPTTELKKRFINY